MLALPAFGEAPEGLSFNGDAEYVRRGPGSARPLRRCRRDLAKRPPPRPPERLSEGPSNASRGEMDRECFLGLILEFRAFSRTAISFTAPDPRDAASIIRVSSGTAGAFRVECNGWRDRQLFSLPRHI